MAQCIYNFYLSYLVQQLNFEKDTDAVLMALYRFPYVDRAALVLTRAAEEVKLWTTHLDHGSMARIVLMKWDEIMNVGPQVVGLSQDERSRLIAQVRREARQIKEAQKFTEIPSRKRCRVEKLDDTTEIKRARVD